MADIQGGIINLPRLRGQQNNPEFLELTCTRLVHPAFISVSGNGKYTSSIRESDHVYRRSEWN